MTRRVDRATRHILNLKRRVDDIEKELAPDATVTRVELASDEVSIADSASLTASPVITGGLQHWYKMDSGSGTTAVDSVGNLDGSINGAAWTTTAKTGGQALEFVASEDDFIQLGKTGIEGVSEFSITAWVTTNTVGPTSGDFNDAVLTANDFTNRITMGYGANTANFSFAVADADDTEEIVNGNAAVAGQFYHLAAVFDNGNMKLYVDADVDATGTFSKTTSPTTTNDHQIGHRVGAFADYHDGIIDDVRIYNKALTDSEVQTIYNNTV